MILNSHEIADRISRASDDSDPLIVTPKPTLQDLVESGTASLDMRLGTWFSTLRKTRIDCLKIVDKGNNLRQEVHLADSYYTPFGNTFILHPRAFVLGITLEWIRLPKDLAAYVIGKSSWGRRGLIIATALGVHPGFTGCITLEISNIGEVPIELKPGMQICQIFLHTLKSISNVPSKSMFAGCRKPILGQIKPDPKAEKLADQYPFSRF